MNRFQEPDCLPPTVEAQENERFALWQQRVLAEATALKEELVEAFYQMGYSLRGERVLRDSGETEYEFKSGGRIIKVTTSTPPQK